jgi:hypothetical protein
MSHLQKRKFSRIQFERKVFLDFFTERHDHCRIKNLSLTGMCIAGSFRQNIGEYCLINLEQKGVTSDLSLRALGKVVRKDNSEIALEFTSMTFESYMYLQVTLLYEADEPMIIGLELPENCPFKLIDGNETIQENYNSFQTLRS